MDNDNYIDTTDCSSDDDCIDTTDSISDNSIDVFLELYDNADKQDDSREASDSTADGVIDIFSELDDNIDSTQSTIDATENTADTVDVFSDLDDNADMQDDSYAASDSAADGVIDVFSELEENVDTVRDAFDDAYEKTESKTDIDTNNEDLDEENSESLDLTFKDKIDGHTYYYDSNGDVYRVDNTLICDTSYDLNGYQYYTDDMGRIVSAEGNLHLRDRERLNIYDKIDDVGLGDERDTDDRGHIIADLFDGPNGIENMIPQDFSINRGEYKAFEKELADEIKRGNDVDLRVDVYYPEDSHRPLGLISTYTINGSSNVRYFLNQ